MNDQMVSVASDAHAAMTWGVRMLPTVPHLLLFCSGLGDLSVNGQSLWRVGRFHRGTKAGRLTVKGEALRSDGNKAFWTSPRRRFAGGKKLSRAVGSLGAFDLYELVVESHDEQRRRPLADEKGLLFLAHHLKCE